MPINLATTIDLYCLSSIFSTETFFDNKLSNENLNKYIDSFIDKIYKDKYKRSAIFHLFNLEVDKDLDIKFGEWSLIKIPHESIPVILGESTPFSRLHFPDVGNDYLIFEDSEQPKDSYEWIKDKYKEAQEVEEILQFFKDEIINIDYYTFYFTPYWVNQIWRMGIFRYGNIRSINPNTKYTIMSQEIDNIKKYWNLYNNNISKFKNIEKSKLGLVIQRAARHFYIYHTKDKTEEKFINLIIALEALFSFGQEVTFRMSLYTAIFLEENKNGEDNYQFVSKMLKLRNKIFHGNYTLREIEEDKFIDDDDLIKLSSIIRKAILGFIVLYLRGDDKKEDIINKIESSIFNLDVRDELVKTSNIDNFIEENIKEE